VRGENENNIDKVESGTRHVRAAAAEKGRGESTKQYTDKEGLE